MSADDFQTKYASVMESMLKSAVAETTKLFETMVDELKAEISRLRKENEDLKTKCNQIESVESRVPIYSTDRESLPGTSDSCEKRDTAVQCDIVRTILVEQCQPLRDSSLQNQEEQWCYEEMEYGLQEHNYVSYREASQMAYIQVKHEDDDHSSLQSVLKQEEDESTVACRQIGRDKAGSLATSACGTESERPHVNQEFSNEHIPLPRKDERTGAQNQSSEPEHSLVISLTAIKDDLEEESEISLQISEIGTQAELKTSAEHPLVVPQQPTEKEQPSVVHQHHQTEGEMPVNEQTDVTLQQYESVHCIVEQLGEPTPRNKKGANDALKTSIAEGNCSPQPVRRKRGRPPKRGSLQQPKKVLQSSSTTTEQEMVTAPSARLKEVWVSSAGDKVNTAASESLKVSPVKSKKTSSIITRSVQDRVNTALEEDVDKVEIGSLSVSEVSLRKRCSSSKEKTSKSQQLFIQINEAEIQTPSNQVSSANDTINTAQTPSLEPRHCRTSVALQDAMLLVEAMNQSTVENASSSPRKFAVTPQTICAPFVGKLQTLNEIPAKSPTALLPVVACEIAGRLPVTDLSTSKQSKVETLKAATKTTDAAPNNEAQAHLKGAIANQQHVVTTSSTTSLPVPLSSAAVQTSVGPIHQHALHHLMPVAPSKTNKKAPQKIIVVPRLASSLVPHKIAALSSTQLPAVVSTVVAARSTSLLPASTAASSPLKTPSLSSVIQKKTYVTPGTLLPIVPSQSSATSRDQQSGNLPQSKITIIIPRQLQSHKFVLTTKQDSATSASTVVLPPQLSSSSQELKGEVVALSSQKTDNTSDNLESSKQTATAPETTNAFVETCSSLNRSVGQELGSVQQPRFEQKFCAMVRLTRLPFPISIKESVVVSKLISNESSETQSIFKERSTQKIMSTQPSEMPELSTDVCPSLKETPVAAYVNAYHEEPIDVQEKASASSEMSTIVKGLQYSSYLQPSTSSRVSTPVISMTEPSADEPTSNLDKEIINNTVQNCALLNYPPIEEKPSTASIQLTAITSKDTSDPHLQMTKTQFLAQLAVSPIVQAPEKVSTNDIPDGTVSDKKTLQKMALVARLRSHLKTQLQIRRAKSNPEPCMETETATVSPKKLGFENEDQNDNTSELVPFGNENGVVAEDGVRINDPFPISPRRSALCNDDVTSKTSVGERTTADSRRSNDTWVRRTSSGIGIESKNNSSSVSPKRSSLTNDGSSHKKINSNTVSPRRTSLTKNTKSTSESSKRASTGRDGASPKNTKSTCVSPRRTSSPRDRPSPPKTKSTSVSPRMSKRTSESLFGSYRRSSFSKVTPSTKQIKRESGSFSPRRFSVTTDGAPTKKAKGKTASQSARSLRKHCESTPAKKLRLSQDGTGSKKNLRMVNAKKLAQAAKAKTIAKMKISKQQKLQNGAKTSQLTGNQSNCEVLKKFTCKAVWIPPRMPITKSPKRETRSLDHTAVYPPSLSIHPIPVKAPPIVSPLQPLLVIGGHLLKNQCGECGRILSSSAALESHVGLHTGRRPFSCTLCGKSFPDSKGLKRHGRVHRNGRIHVCPQCGKGFVYRFGLTKHLQMVHGRLKPFVCQICNKGFYTKRDVEAHIRIHTGEKPFHCNLCEKKFTRRVELNVHLRWHNGEKRHWCPYCGKGFLDFNNLKRHKYIHTGEKPHSCPHCPKRFTQSGHLKKHVKNVHKIE